MTFKRWDNPDGPEYSIPKGDVFKIRYANGSSDIFEENNDKLGVDDNGRSLAATKYMDKRTAPKDHNIISFAPLAFTENGYGFSFSYERTLDKRGWVSFYCPLYLAFSSNSSVYNPTTQQNQVSNFYNPMYYIMPGIKFYTNMNTVNRVKHSLALNLVMAVGKNENGSYDLTSGYVSTSQSRFMLGALASYGGNMFPTNHLYLGYDIGLGMPYINNYDGEAHSLTPLFQMSLRVGYRFVKKAR